GRLRHRRPRRPARAGARRVRAGGPRLRALPARRRPSAGCRRRGRRRHGARGDEVPAGRLRALPRGRPLGGRGEAGRLRRAGARAGPGRLHRGRGGDGADARGERAGSGGRGGRLVGALHRQPGQLPRAARGDLRPRARAREGEAAVRVVRYGTAAWRRYREGLPRTSAPRPAVERAVASILRQVRRDGDAALVRLTARFDGVRLRPRDLRVPAERIRALARRADPSVVASLKAMAARIEAYHTRQRDRGFRLRLRDGTRLEEQVRALDSVGLYVPGGAGAYPSSVLMSAIP